MSCSPSSTEFLQVSCCSACRFNHKDTWHPRRKSSIKRQGPWEVLWWNISGATWCPMFCTSPFGRQSSVEFSWVQLLSGVWLFATPWTAAHQASLSITNSRSLLKLMSIQLVMSSNYLILCHPLLLSSIFPSIRVFSNESVLLIRGPKYWSFSFSISLPNEYSGLISFRMDCLDLLAVQETLKTLLQHHSLKASVLWYSDFFIVQLSHPCEIISTWNY